MSDTGIVEQESEGELVRIPDNLPANPIEMLAVAVTQGRLDVDSMKGLMELEREYRADIAKEKYVSAMVRFAALKEVIAHNTEGEGPSQSTFTYTDYPTLVAAVTPWMQTCGLSFVHKKDPPVIESGKVVLIMVYCEISHKAGHTERFEFPAIPDVRLQGKVSAVQLIQMAVTYAKRQSLCDGCGIATGEEGALDDDGNRVNPAQRSDDKEDTRTVWFNDAEFERMKHAFIREIQAGNRTGKDIVKNLRVQDYAISKEMAKKIEELE